ncbi:g3551 [Coccomyxa viridis]|uniref:G3551 protein n=1 Tax=Coccomyxa viridis TaxID=1274662 RepID=A0ABP1FN34_9CHLO
MIKMGQVSSCLRSAGGAFGTLWGCAPSKAVTGRDRERYRQLRTSASSYTYTQVETYDVPTSRITKQLTNVVNARDLAEACRAIAPGRLIRSACPVDATEHDVLIIREMLQVSRLVDLRSNYERKSDGIGYLMKHAEIVGKRKHSPAVQPKVGRQVSPDPSDARLVVHHLSLLERSRYYGKFIMSLPFSTAAKIVFWTVLLNQRRAISIAMTEINKAGLPGLYSTILATAGPELCKALELLTEAAEAGETTLFFCKIGKDRTGLLAAMVLTCCGASVDEIVTDYARSDDVGAVALGGMEKEELKGLDVSVFSRAPPQALLTTLEHLKDTYGGTEEYMASIGFGVERQLRLAKSLRPTMAEPL